MIEVKNLEKSFKLQTNTLPVLKKINFSVEQGRWLSVTGPSGSGKTTLLSLLAGLETPSNGAILIDGEDITKMDEDSRARFRAHNMGFVFQSFRLLPTLTALENVQVTLEILGQAHSAAKAAEMLERVGLKERLHHYPSQLSGGEQQRVAIARAFVGRPKILFADEPTGNLDSKNGERVLELLNQIHQESKATLIIVTHDLGVAARADQQLRLKDGEQVG